MNNIIKNFLSRLRNYITHRHDVGSSNAVIRYLSLLARATRSGAQLFRRIATWSLIVVILIVLIPFAIGNFVLSTPRDHSYRNLHPYLAICQEGLKTGWKALAEPQINGKSIDNDENALRKDDRWAERLRCALQRHVIPSASVEKNAIDYHLAFLEFQENGWPYLLGSQEKDKDTLTYKDLWKVAPEESGVLPPMTQLEVLYKHLSKGSHYVIVFVHGWRHNADIGDENIADLRHYAAHSVRHLKQRCETEGLYCDTKVTAVYVGWRGARVNEAGMKRWFGDGIGGFVGRLATATTLFDRKPVSEQIAPGVVSALRGIERTLSERNDVPRPETRMIVIGHSLGGNILATGLQDDVIKLVRRHKPGNHIPGLFGPGSLVVLVNPAAEATKWTAIQREVWSRIAYYEDVATPVEDVISGHNFVPLEQKPVLISLTSAASFPAGGLREPDCRWLAADVDDGNQSSRKSIRAALENNQGIFSGTDYDFATHVLFPIFKFDFRPLALWLDRKKDGYRYENAKRHPCDNHLRSTTLGYMKSLPLSVLSRVLREFPFQNTDQELTRTIGHLDPPRPVEDVLINRKRVSALPFGTTHEIYGHERRAVSGIKKYAELADTELSCPQSRHWLSRARKKEEPHGTNWDSNYLAPVSAGTTVAGPPAAHFIHGFLHGGQEPPTRANDAFWNLRAFDNVVSGHQVFRRSSIICVMSQLVMDDPA